MVTESIHVAYIGLGSNLNQPVSQIEQAIQSLSHLFKTRLLKVSPFYRNKPLGPLPQPDYVNAVAALETLFTPEDLFDCLQDIEQKQGRIKVIHWGPRIIDLDLLLYDQLVLQTDKLVIPHPGLKSRAFVLRPLIDIAPHLKLPDGVSVLEAYEDIGAPERI